MFLRTWGVHLGRPEFALIRGVQPPRLGLLVIYPNTPGYGISMLTPDKINMEPEHGPLEDYFPLQTSGFQVPC